MADYNGEQPPPYTGPNMQQQRSTNPKHVGYDQHQYQPTNMGQPAPPQIGSNYPQQQPANMGQPAQPQMSSPNPLYSAGYDQPGAGYIHTGQVNPQEAPYPYPMVQQPPVTNVNVTQVSTGGPSLLMVPTISDQTGTAIFVCLCCFFPTGIPAIIYASRAQDEFSEGNYVEAQRSNNMARRMILLSIILPWVIGGIMGAILAVSV